MYKSIAVTVALMCALTIVSAIVTEDAQVRTGMTDAFQRGLEKFGGGAAKADKAVPAPSVQESKVFSLYSKGIKAPGGGKPSVLDQYRAHHYVPDAPVVVPEEHSAIHGKMTPEQAAERYRPHPEFQYTTDRFHI